MLSQVSTRMSGESMKKAHVLFVAAALSAPAVALGGFFGEDRTVRYTVAADYVNTTVSPSSGAGLPSDRNFSSDFVNIKLGLRPEAMTARSSFLTFELHGGVPLRDDEDLSEAETKQYFGAFIVPHAVVLDMFEVSFPVGYTRSKIGVRAPDENDDIVSMEESFDSISFGGNIMLPLRLLMPNGPDIRISAGGQVYHQDSSGRIYGYNAGLRWDF